MLIVDDREPAQLRKRACEAVEDCNVQRLPQADYLIFDQDGHIAAIERKQIADLLASITRGKLHRQLSNLGKFDRRILLVEGHWSLSPSGKILTLNRESGWVASTVQMMLLGLQESLGVSLLWVSGQQELIATIVALVKQGQKGCFVKGAS